MLCIPTFIPSFVLIICMYLKIIFPDTTGTFKNQSSSICLGYVYLIFWQISSPVMVFQKSFINSCLYMPQYTYPYYISKEVLVVETEEGSLDNFPIRVQKKKEKSILLIYMINTVSLHAKQ